MDKIKTIKIKNPDGSISEETYTISVDAKDVDMKNGKDLQETIGTIDIDTDGNVSEQLNHLSTDIKKKTYCFDTVSDMQIADLKEGDYVYTLGYYDVNDGGKAFYKIDNHQDNTQFQENLNNGLYATLILDETIKVKQLGIFPNTNKNVLELLQKAINTEKIVENDTINDKISISASIKTTGSIKLKNLYIACEFTGNVSLLDFSQNHNGIDIIIENCLFDGKSVSIGVNGRNLPEINNFEIKNTEIKNMSSQGYMSGTFPTAWAITLKGLNVLADNCYVHDNQGHGLMISALQNENSNNGVYNIINCRAENNGLNTYQALGIGSYSGVNNARVFIDNCYAYSNGASGIAPHGINNVIIQNCISNNNREHGLVVQQSHDSIVNNCIALNNASFGIRVQGDFAIQQEERRFVDNVIIENNKITGNGIKVGVKATNVICKNNTITITPTQFPFYTDNGNTSRNNNSKNVSFINNIVIGETQHAEIFRDYFDKFIIQNNTNEKGILIPNGFLVNSIYSHKANLYISTDELYESITPFNNNVETYKIRTYNGTTVNDGTFSIAAPLASDSYLFEQQYALNDNESITFNIEFPNGTIPSIRYRTESESLKSDPALVSTIENNGYLNKMTITWTGDNSDSDVNDIKYISVALKTVRFENLPAGTYNYKITGAYGLKIHK